jgi:ribosomal protein S6E (S10)
VTSGLFGGLAGRSRDERHRLLRMLGDLLHQERLIVVDQVGDVGVAATLEVGGGDDRDGGPVEAGIAADLDQPRARVRRTDGEAPPGSGNFEVGGVEG